MRGDWELAVCPPIERVNTATATTFACWNCKEISHAVRDCPKPINHATIGENKNKFLKMKRNKKWEKTK